MMNLLVISMANDFFNSVNWIVIVPEVDGAHHDLKNVGFSGRITTPLVSFGLICNYNGHDVVSQSFVH